jgi:YaiO family outer membrane protein
MSQNRSLSFAASLLLACLSLIPCAAGAQAIAAAGQEPAQAAPPVQPGAATKMSMELSAGSQSLTNGYGHWRDVTLRGTWGLPANVIQAELSQHSRFNQDGTYASISDTHTFNDDWYGALALGVGDGAFYLPRYRVDATLYRKWLADRSLVTSVGAGYYDAPDGHTDKSVALGLIYYFEVPLVAEGGVRFNVSDPGGIRTHQQYVALTYGRDKQDLVSARYGWGGEGYLATGAGSQLVNFDSREASLAWRHWITPRTGLLLSATRYSNPAYTRTGVNAGLLYEF